MSYQLKQSIKRALWTILFSGIGQIVVALTIIPVDQLLSLNWKMILTPFIAGILMGAKKYVTWTDLPPV